MYRSLFKPCTSRVRVSQKDDSETGSLLQKSSAAVFSSLIVLPVTDKCDNNHSQFSQQNLEVFTRLNEVHIDHTSSYLYGLFNAFSTVQVCVRCVAKWSIR